jgi:hypothetical protein
LCLDIHTLSLFQKQSRTVYSNNTMKYTALLVLAFAAVAIADGTPAAGYPTPCTGPSCPAKPEYKTEPTPKCTTKECLMPKPPKPVEHEHNKRKYDINFFGALGIKVDHGLSKFLEGGGLIKDFVHNRKADLVGFFESVGYKLALRKALKECHKKKYKEVCEEHCPKECKKQCAGSSHGMCHDTKFKIILEKCTTTCHKALIKECPRYVEESSSSSSSSSSEQKYEAPKPGYQAPGYQAPSSSSSSSSEQKYDVPKPGYEAPKPGYEAPKPGYQAPKSDY